MTPIETVGLTASVIAIFEAGYLIGRSKANRHRKATEEEIVTNRLKQVLGAVRISQLRCDLNTPMLGQTVALSYEINSDTASPCEVWLGASLVDQSRREYFDVSQDKPITLQPGKNKYNRYLTIPKHISLGKCSLIGAVWLGQTSKPENSIRIARSEDVALTVQHIKAVTA